MYTPPDFDDIDFVLVSGYTAPADFDDIDFEMTYDPDYRPPQPLVMIIT